MENAEILSLVQSVNHWHHAFEIAPGISTPGSYNPGFMWQKLGLSRCDGMRALDIGASDGYFTKMLAEAGAEVTAVDYRNKKVTGFWLTEMLIDTPVKHIQASIYDLPGLEPGQFDIVLFMGVLYHLPDMIQALRIVRSLSGSRMFLETWYDASAPEGVSFASYHRGNTARNDPTNFWAPSLQCLRDMLEDTGFRVVREDSWGDRCLIEAAPVIGRTKADLAYGLIG
jgi:tRNA (mo5U34)-methyltransferase